MLEAFTKAIKEECDNAIKYGIYGTRSFHIEKIEQIEDKDGALNFLVTTWDDENDPEKSSRETKEMNLFDIMDLLGRIIGHRAMQVTLAQINLFEQDIFSNIEFIRKIKND